MFYRYAQAHGLVDKPGNQELQVTKQDWEILKHLLQGTDSMDSKDIASYLQKRDLPKPCFMRSISSPTSRQKSGSGQEQRSLCKDL